MGVRVPPSAPGRAAWKRGACEARGRRGHERGEGAPRFHAARRCAPRIETPLRASGARRRVPIPGFVFVKGGVPPFTLSPRSRGQRTSSLPLFFARSAKRHSLSRHAGQGTPTRRTGPTSDRHHGVQARERRPPVGTARRRRAAGRTPPPRMTPLSAGTQTTRRARDSGAPVSDRHRAGARNQRR